MREREIVEAMARLEGLTHWSEKYPTAEYKNEFLSGNYWKSVENLPYNTSHDAVQRVVDGLHYSDLIEYRETLYDMPEFIREYDHHKATPRQKCEAILRAKGLWTESEKGADDE